MLLCDAMKFRYRFTWQELSGECLRGDGRGPLMHDALEISTQDSIFRITVYGKSSLRPRAINLGADVQLQVLPQGF